MNIQEAKQEIKKAVTIYLKKDETGAYQIPTVRQRPMFMIGAPGIGKTAIMAQIAQELDIALVSYAMTHHTRQSALGLPFITEKDYDGDAVQVSEYTMSEIIASIYDTIESSGKKEGILFLDEINCVSETLAPAMLQFLQYKEFGRHKVPDGWVIVCAGNPPEYNKSVRDFDIVTLDRLRKLVVEEDYPAWRSYARNQNIHGAILGYLDLKKDQFYHIETTVDGPAYVTARGWEDLSEAMKLYEAEGFEINERLIYQYLAHKKTSRSFAAFYDLYRLYENTYNVPAILQGEASEETLKRAQEAKFDERLSFLGLLVRALTGHMREYHQFARLVDALYDILKDAPFDTTAFMRHIDDAQVALDEELGSRQAANSLLKEDRAHMHRLMYELEGLREQVADAGDPQVAKDEVNQMLDTLEADAAKIVEAINHVFAFVEKAYGEGDQLLILVTELTLDEAASSFLAEYEVPSYLAHYNVLEMDKRNEALQRTIQDKLKQN